MFVIRIVRDRKVPDKLSQLFKAKNTDNLILTVRGSNELLNISAKELEKLKEKRNMWKIERSTTMFGNFVNLPFLDKGTSNQALTSTRLSLILGTGFRRV